MSTVAVTEGGRALVVADGDVPDRAALDRAWPGWDTGLTLIVAADGGARHLAALELRVDLLVGDFDSLPEAALLGLAKAGAEVLRSPADKDESDTELALLAAAARGVREITVLGALGGGRFDHAVANLLLLAHPALAGIPVELVDERTRVTLVAGPGGDGGPATRPLPGPVGGLVSLLPLAGEAQGVTTGGLAFPLRDESLPAGPARGLSNVRVNTAAWVSLRRGRLLVIESRGAGPG